MNDVIEIYKLNNVFLRISCNEQIAYELHDSLSCFIKNYFFHPKVKAKLWSGKVSFFNLRDNTIPIGLLSFLLKFCKDNHYEYVFKFDVNEMFNEITDEQLQLFYSMIFKDTKFFPRDYQQDAIRISLTKKRSCCISATGSGKSIIIYTIIRFLLALEKQVLLVVPNVSLCEQMKKDFMDYGWTNCDAFVDILYSGKFISDRPVLISTWQSLVNKDQEFFKRFGGLLVDECVHPRSLVLMSNRKTKRIRDIKLGQRVKSFNFETQAIESKPVKSIYTNLNRSEQMYELTLSNNRKINITGNHKIWSRDKWKRVDELNIGDFVFNMERYK